MILDFTKRKYFYIEKLMERGKYKLHHNKQDYIKEDLHGRFHIKYEDKKVYTLHYDIDVDWRHFSINLPEKCGQERKRLRNLSYKLFPVEMEWKKEKDNSNKTLYDILKSKEPIKKKIKGLAFTPSPTGKVKVKRNFTNKIANAEDVKRELALIKLKRQGKNTFINRLLIRIGIL